jgi:SAM-dependent methyltransferase
MSESSGVPDPDLFYSLYTGGFKPQMVRLALLLDVFSPLAAGPAGVQTVARACGCDPTGTRLLLDYLASLGLVQRRGETYSLTPTAAAFLVPGAQTYAGDWLLAHTDPAFWDGAEQALRGGHRARQAFPWAQDAWLQSLRPAQPQSSLAMWRAAGIEPGRRGELRILDLGCGCAIKSLALAQADPQVHLTCVDRAEVLEVARALAGRMGVLARTALVPGDLHTLDLGQQKYGAILLGYVTDYLSPEQNRDLFRRALRALVPGGTLLIDVHPAPETPGEFAATMALLAWAISGCTPYPPERYHAWLEEAGFSLVRQVGQNWFSARVG